VTEESARPAPLAGLRVIAVEQYGAGPFGSLYLADLGAEIVKIEDPGVGGDVSRYIPPGVLGTDSLFFEAFNRSKRSVALDLKHPGGRAVFERLVASADAVYSNLRGDQPARLGLRYADLAAVNPRIVCVALSGYGDRPDQATLPGYDALVQAQSGWAALTGDPAGPPTAGFSTKFEIATSSTPGYRINRRTASMIVPCRSPRFDPSAMYAVTHSLTPAILPRAPSL